MDSSSEARRVPIWLIALTASLGLLAMLGSLFADVRRIDREREVALAWRSHSYEVIIAANELLAAMQAAETGYRGYLLTGDVSFRIPYDRDRSRIAGQLTILRDVLARDPVQAVRYADIDSVAKRRLAKLDLGMLMLMRGKRADAVQSVKTGEGQRTMEEFRQAIANLKVAEIRALGHRAALAEERTADARMNLIGAAAAGLMLLLVAGMLAMSAWRAALNDARRKAAAEAVSRLDRESGDRLSAAA